MSINLVLENEDDAVIWRGPLIGKAIQQFWEDVLWGNLDCLLVDLPPGTADAPLTVMQSLPVSGVVLVFSPQELAAMVVRKAVKMTKQMNKPILGVVENMSYFTLPDSGKKLELFGKSRGDEMSQVTGAPLLGKLPVDPQLAQLCDDGEIEKYTSDAFEELAQNFIQVLEK
jgi:Mrp family chromosome partitioning ATPase